MFEEFLDWRESSRCPLIYSTALETAVGTANSLAIASSDSKNQYALGFGVQPFFGKDYYSNTKNITALFNQQSATC